MIWGKRNSEGPQFYEPKLTVEASNNHIYYYADVDSDRCLALMKEIRDADGMLRNEFVSRDLPKEFPMIPIWLHIYSPGGDLFSGLAVADQIRHIETPIYSIIEGYCASAATLISMACTRRYIRPSAFMLIHQLSSAMWGKYDDFLDEVHLMDMAMDRLVRFYKKNSKLGGKRIRKLLGRDSWFNARECIELGLTDKII